MAMTGEAGASTSAAAQVAFRPTTFEAAFPYGAASVATAAVGTTIAVISTTLIVKIIGIAAAIIGSYTFLGTLFCALIHADDSEKFQSEVFKYITTTVASGISDICISIVKEVIASMIWGRGRY